MVRVRLKRGMARNCGRHLVTGVWWDTVGLESGRREKSRGGIRGLGRGGGALLTMVPASFWGREGRGKKHIATLDKTTSSEAGGFLCRGPGSVHVRCSGFPKRHWSDCPKNEWAA